MKTQRKQQAQEIILQALISAYYQISDHDDLTDDEKKLLAEAIDEQHRRVEKLFGYIPGSCGRS